MRWKKPENTSELTALGLQVVSVVLVIVIAVEVTGAFVNGSRAQGTIKAAVALGANDPNNLETYLTGQKETVEALKKKNMFMPPPEKPKPPTVAGILGHSALINGKWHKVGETVAGAKIIAIFATEIKIMWEGKEMSLAPIKAASSSAPKTKPKPKRVKRVRKNKPKAKAPAAVVAAAPVAAEVDDLDWLDIPAHLKEKFRVHWNKMTDEQKQQFKEQWAKMSDEQKKQLIQAWEQGM